MLSCKEVSKLVSQAQDRSLTLGERLSVRMHLLMCRMCRRYQKQLAFLTQAGRRFSHLSHAGAFTLTEKAKARMKQKLEEAVRQQAETEPGD